MRRRMTLKFPGVYCPLTWPQDIEENLKPMHLLIVQFPADVDQLQAVGIEAICLDANTFANSRLAMTVISTIKLALHDAGVVHLGLKAGVAVEKYVQDVFLLLGSHWPVHMIKANEDQTLIEVLARKLPYAMFSDPRLIEV